MPVRTSKFHLRTILLIVSLTVLILPLGSIFFFRIYENSLVQQTETELISQAAFISAIYKKEIRNIIDDDKSYGIEQIEKIEKKLDAYYTPIKPKINLSENSLLSRRPDGIVPNIHADAAAIAAGKIVAPVLTDAQRTTLSGVKILDFNGITVSGRFETALSFAHTEEVKSAMRGKYTSVIRQRISDEPSFSITSISREANIRVFIALPIVSNGRVWGIVYLSRTPENILHHLYEAKTQVAFAGISILCMTLLLAFFISHTISKPIYQLISKTKRVAEGQDDIIQRLESPVTKEIEMLSQSFSEMSLTLHQRSEYIKEFAAHVSHEFKTPLTSMQGAAELLLEHFDDMSEAEKQTFLKNIIQDTNRLKRLVTRLLELARADNVKSNNEISELSNILKHIQQKYTSKKLKLTVEVSENISVKISPDNLEEIFINLIDNSTQHGAKTINIVVTEQNNQLELKIVDDGEGISSANRDKIFTPFFTTKRETGGTGLGLGIVKSLIEAHKGTITLGEQASGAKFIITFPAN